MLRTCGRSRTHAVRLSRQHRYFILFTLSTFRLTNSHATFAGPLAVLGPALLRISARTERFSHSHSVLSEKYHLVQYLLVFHTLKLFDTMAASRRKDLREDILQDLRQVIADHSHISDKSPLHMAILDATQDLLKVDDKNTQMVPAVYKSHITKKLLDHTTIIFYMFWGEFIQDVSKRKNRTSESEVRFRLKPS